MSLGSGEGLDRARAGRLSEDSSKGAEWSSSEEGERFSTAPIAMESSPSSRSATGAYWDELDFALLEENMARAGHNVEKSSAEREDLEKGSAVSEGKVKAGMAPMP